MSVFTPCSDECVDPTTELVMEPNSPDSRVFVDQAPGNPMTWYRGHYIYDDSAGDGVEVYVIDTGANLTNPVSSSLPSDRPDISGQ